MDKLPGKYKTYSPEFREEAARLVIDSSRPIADVARELQISETSLVLQSRFSGAWLRCRSA
jgi:transposase-like protein